MADLSTPPLARQMSVRAVVEALMRAGSLSRAELARVTGLSKQTASEVVRELEANGWVRERGQTQGFVGRSATTYEIDVSRRYVLGVDLGGTKVHVALADLAGAIVSEEVEATDRRGGRHVVEQIGALSAKAAASAGVDHGRIHCGAMGSPGVFQPGSGRINIAPNIPGLDEIDVAGELRRRLGFEMVVENDVNLAAMGERWRGCCRESGTFAFVALGTGIGMGMMADGRLVRGARGAAGEIAYLPLGGDPFDSRGYRLGTLETAIGGVAILERYRGLGGADAHDVRAIFERWNAGDPAARTTVEEVARLLAQALMAVRAVLDPELIVLGGSIGARPELVDAVRSLLPRFMPEPLRVEPSALGSRAAIVGAVGTALLALYDAMFGVTDLPAEPDDAVTAA
ncbi:ROK family transcriptional regulator [Alsobacter soli]|uniref:ROK family transcriptional regulator n=1 Tax=Alsobacter soli TaxID=2109933 RepID=A0A2T1HWV9_9HYPH|nr:ROK family transcriptional regulator [Alsobacter soli]PSC06080.1 ROK family transcriptional regulator [Alsobacter soli]